MLNLDFLEKGLRLLHFGYYFSRKIFRMLYSINWPNLIVWLPLLLEILGNMCIAIICFPDCDVINFGINLTPNQAIFLYDRKAKTKIEIPWERKELLRWNKKHFSLFLKAFQLPKIVSDLRVRIWNKVILWFLQIFSRL